MFTIGIAGGSGSGKTTLVNAILKRIPVESIALLAQDAYYKDASHLPLEQRRALNFDHPDSIEWDLMLSDIRKLKSGQAIECPTYSYITCTRLPETIHIEPKKYFSSRAFSSSLNLKFAKKWTCACTSKLNLTIACRALLNAIWKIAAVQLSRS